jgi:phosphatidylserine/phosphatidylglycerophosphate/cardiolipin synthase-like enzyme
LLGLLALLLVATGLWHVAKPPPPGTAVHFAPEPVDEVVFLADLTWVDGDGERMVRQEIFDTALAMIAAAPSYVLADQFLYNAVQGARPERTRALAEELTAALVARKQALPPAEVILITDPINRIYGGRVSPELAALRAAGVTVVETDLRPLRDSNPLWSAPWRLLVAPWGRPTGEGGTLPNPFDPNGDPIPIRSWLELLNFKANHRKTLVVDLPGAPGRLATLVGSANPHNGSSAHGNVALQVTGPVARAVAESERAVASFSGVEIPPPPTDEGTPPADRTGAGSASPSNGLSAPVPDVRVGMVTESAIQDALLTMLARAGAGDRVDMAMFYLSDREVIVGLKYAAERGATLRLLLDPNKDAFGRTKNGIPNRPVAWELREHAHVRWCDTHGEQCHAKMVLVRYGEPATEGVDASLLLGSANLTRRNLDDLNLETNLLVEAPADAAVMRDAAAYFERSWSNEPERLFSVDYDAWAESTSWKRALYHIMESAGLSTF